MAEKVNVRYIDVKGEKGRVSLPDFATFAEALWLSGLGSLSQVGWQASAQVETTAFAAPTDPGSSALVSNDKDFKAILNFKYTTIGANFRIIIPAPKINIEGGIIFRRRESKQYVPPVKLAGETGQDGTELAVVAATTLGLTAGTVKFSSGSLVKSAN